jgi:hypothetical protein
VPQLAYTACLLEEQLAWSATPTPAGQSPQQQQQQQLSLCASAAPLSSTALAAMAQCVAQAVLQPSDAHAAATAGLQVRRWCARLLCCPTHGSIEMPVHAQPALAPAACPRPQLALEAAFRQQQRAVEAQAAAHADAAEALAAKVAHRKVNMQAAGLPLYQAVFQDVVEYVCAAAGLQARAAAGGDARAQVSAAVESAMPLSSLAFFLTLPAQERLQQVRVRVLHGARRPACTRPSVLPVGEHGGCRLVRALTPATCVDPTTHRSWSAWRPWPRAYACSTAPRATPPHP